MMARPPGDARAETQIFDAVKQYVDGVKVDDIAEAFHVSQPTVSYWVRKHGEEFFGKKFKSRTQGRRQAEAPTDRDKAIIQKVLSGVPPVRVSEEYNLKRQRVSFIVKTWQERGYEPEPMFKAGQVVKDNPRGVARYLIVETLGFEGGRVLQIVEWDEDKKKPRRLSPGIEIDDFKWYAGKQLCEVVDDTPTSQRANPANAKAVSRA